MFFRQKTAYDMRISDGSSDVCSSDLSFWCAVIVLPAYIPLVIFGRGLPNGDAGFFRIVSVETIAYVIGWVAWPLLMSYLAPALDKNRQYIRYIVAYNWSAGPQDLVRLRVLLLETGKASGG